MNLQEVANVKLVQVRQFFAWLYNRNYKNPNTEDNINNQKEMSIDTSGTDLKDEHFPYYVTQKQSCSKDEVIILINPMLIT